MIADLIARVERIQENASLKDDHGQSKCQEFQLIQVFGTDKYTRYGDLSISLFSTHEVPPPESNLYIGYETSGTFVRFDRIFKCRFLPYCGTKIPHLIEEVRDFCC